MKAINLVGRILFSLIFITAATGHFKAETIAYAKASGVPLADLAVPASGVLSLLAGLSVLLGYKVKWGAAATVAFLVPVTLTMHKFWGIADPMMAQMQQVMFMKNVALIGGALILAYAGAGAYSVDAWLETRRARTSAAIATT